MSKFIVGIGLKPYVWHGDVYYDDFERIEVQANSESEAMTLGAIKAFPGTPRWAQETVPMHFHYAREARDCDSTYSSSHTAEFPAESQFDYWGNERTANERLAILVADREMPYLLQMDSDLWRIDTHEGTKGLAGCATISIFRSTEEGYETQEYQACEDELCWDHIEGRTSYRDRTAESMNY